MKAIWLVLLTPVISQCTWMEPTGGRGQNGASGGKSALVSAPRQSGAANEDFFTEDVSNGGAVPDPFEKFNRAVFAFNDKIYDWILRPLNKGYRAITPDFVEEGVGNFFENLGQPRAMVHEILQGKPVQAAETLGSFLVNSTIGLGGVIEVKERHDDVEDLGQTLDKWGLPHGFYMVLPVLGPSSLKDTIGKVGDAFLYPTYYVPDDEIVRYIIIGVNNIDSATELLKLYDSVTEAAIDPYIMTRQSYIEARNAAAAN